MNWLATLFALFWIAPAVGIALGLTLSISHEELAPILGGDTWLLPAFAATFSAAGVALIVSESRAKAEPQNELRRAARRALLIGILSLIGVPFIHAIPRLLFGDAASTTIGLDMNHTIESLFSQVFIVSTLLPPLFAFGASVCLIARRQGLSRQ